VAHQGGGGELAGVGRNGAPVADGEGGKHGEGEGSSGNLTEVSPAVGRRRRRRATAGKTGGGVFASGELRGARERLLTARGGAEGAALRERAAVL
jgi:hypothetical protein